MWIRKLSKVLVRSLAWTTEWLCLHYMNMKHNEAVRDAHSSRVEFALSIKHFKWIFIIDSWKMSQENSGNYKDTI